MTNFRKHVPVCTDYDFITFQEMKKMWRSGIRTARPAAMSKRLRRRGIRIDVVQALGSMLRMLPVYQNWLSRAAAGE